MTMRKGFLYFQDIYCMHCTWRRGGGPRVSMDWTIQTKNYPEIEKLYSSKALAFTNHVPLETWFKVGQSYQYTDIETISQCAARFKGFIERDALQKGTAIAGQTSTTAKIFNIFDSKDELTLARFE
jgi:hypothetical protein